MRKVVQVPIPNRALQGLWELVLEKHLRPEDDDEVAAVLESMGWTDKQVQLQFGVTDVFELARDLRQLDSHKIGFTPNQFKEKEHLVIVLKQVGREFIRGVVFALPMVLSIIAMLTLRFSLWSYQYLETRIATAIAIGTILSFVSVGGFVQAMARQGYFFMFQGYYRMMQRMTFRFIIQGVVTSGIVSIVAVVLDVVFPELPIDMMVLAIVYYLGLNIIWLTVAVLYIIRREIWFSVLLGAGIGLVYAGFRVLHLNILITQIIAMLLVAFGAIALLRSFFKKEEMRKERGINPPLPRFAVTLYNVAPYFIYGMLYFALLFCDRIMAWSTHVGYVPLVIWFRGDYELGLDFALITLILPMGISEIIVSRMMTQIWSSQKDYMANEADRMNGNFTQMYGRNVIRMVVVSGVNAAFVYFFFRWFVTHYMSKLPGHIELGSTSIYVFVVALMAYTILSIGLLNSVVMFSLSRSELVIRPILISLGLNFVTGFLATRWIAYPEAVWGLLAGCICFTLLTSRNILHVLRQIDYHMYLLS